MRRLSTLLAIVLFVLLQNTRSFADGIDAVSEHLLSASYNGVILKLKTNIGEVKIQPLTSTIIRVSRDESSIRTDAVVLRPEKIKSVYREKPDCLLFVTDSLTIRIFRNPFQIEYKVKRTGRTLLSETGFARDKDRKSILFRLQKEEQITGGGERAISLNRRGKLLKLFNEPHWGYGYGEETLNFSIPYFISDNGYGLFFDNSSLGYADLGKTDPEVMKLSATGGSMNYYILYSPTVKGLVREWTHLTGRQPLPSRWVFGNIQSRFGYKSQEETMEMARKIRGAGYPLDAIVLDLYWFGRAKEDWRMGDLDWDKNYWPSPEKMIGDLKKEGVKTILITEPFILKTSKTAANALQKNAVALDSLGNPGLIKDFYFGPAYLLDLFDGKAQDWFWNYYDKQIKIDVAGWWGDLGEPERHPSFLRHLNGKAWDVHNIYGQYWNKMISEKYKANYPAQRVFHLNRSGFAGSQRYGIFPWSGDVGRSWNGLKAQIPIMTIMGLSGIPYMHSDLGGFAAGVKDEELYTRWLQMGVFNPVFRPHGESIPSEPIFFNDTTQRIVKEYIRLRYRMVPYNYSIARNHNLTGDPLVRSLYWETSRKADFSNMDCYFWGDNLLVFPIYEKGQKFKKVFIPQGKWFNFTTDKIIEGGDTLMVSTSPEELPVLVKAGSFIPMTTPLSDMDQYNSNEYVVHYYADNSVANSSFTIYEDDGKDARAMAKGTYEIITLKCKTNPDKLQFLLQSNGGNYPGKPVSRSITLVLHHAQGKKIVVNGKTIRNIPFEQEKHSILRYVNYEEKPQVLKFNWNGKELN